MPGFNVLDRTHNIHRNHLLEASAGTGKTYAIENIVLRLLVEPCPHTGQPLALDQILVMTFTKAAVRDLKVRIRQNLCMGNENDRNRLDHALFCYDQAQIFTIHSFCYRMLNQFLFEGGLSLDVKGGEDTLPTDLMRQVMHAYFHTHVTREHYSPNQLRLLTAKFDHDQIRIEDALLELLKYRPEIISPSSFKDAFYQFQTCLKGYGRIEGEKLLSDYHLLVPVLNKIEGDVEAAIQRFAKLIQGPIEADDFDRLLPDWSLISAIYSPEKRHKRKKFDASQLHYATLIHDLDSIVKPTADPDSILLQIAAACQKNLKQFLNDEELMGHDDTLLAMQRAVQHVPFAHNVRQQYKAVIVDEFQDTDPIQWEIIRTLFLSEQWPGYLYLVGDPKQSIYAFRNADIYTYLDAARALGEDAKATLDTNFRSQPALVEALNTLFGAIPHLIELPKIKASIPYLKVKAGIKEAPGDPSHCLQLWRFNKEREIYPSVAHEIHRLIQDLVPAEAIAILVSDRHQGKAILQELTKWNIPAAYQRLDPLATSPALKVLRDLLAGVMTPRHESTLKTALAGPLIAWNCEQILALEDPALYEKVLVDFFTLRGILYTQGFAPFWQLLLHRRLGNDLQTIEERLLSREGGLELRRDCLHLVELLIAHQSQRQASPEALLKFLENFSQDEQKRRMETDQKAVQILTIHSSKGLEFDSVFVLGLCRPMKYAKRVFPNPTGETLHPLDEQNPLYQAHIQELEAEKMRQLYVALTRAKTKLYVCFLEGGKESSAFDLFLQKLDRPLEALNSAQILLQTKAEAISVTPLPPPVAPILYPPKQIDIAVTKAHMFSYSSLSKGHSAVQMPSQDSPHDFNETSKTVHTMPSGAAIGNLLHAIYEVIPLDKAEKAKEPFDLLPLIKPFMEGSEFASWQMVIAETVYNSLKTPLPFKTGFAPLATVNPSSLYRETEFMFPWEQALQLPSIESQAGFIKGVIDFIFEHEGFYYLVDWKSNWLGPTREYYQQQFLQQAMEDNGYILQAHVYKEALRRYLAVVDARPFEEIFGGMFYLFVRGLDAQTNDQNGIYMVEHDR